MPNRRGKILCVGGPYDGSFVEHRGSSFKACYQVQDPGEALTTGSILDPEAEVKVDTYDLHIVHTTVGTAFSVYGVAPWTDHTVMLNLIRYYKKVGEEPDE